MNSFKKKIMKYENNTIEDNIRSTYEKMINYFPLNVVLFAAKYIKT